MFLNPKPFILHSLQFHSIKAGQSGSVQPPEHAHRPPECHTSLSVWHWRNGQALTKAPFSADASTSSTN